MSRRLAALAVAGLLAAPATAHAAPKPVCNLVRDARGDTQSPAPDKALDAQLDVLSADVATSSKYVTVVLRLAELSEADYANPQGRVYEFDFTAQEKNFIVMGSLLPGGNDWSVFISGTRLEENKSGARAATGIGSARGNVDTVRREVRMTVPLSVFAPHADLRGGTLYHLSAFTYRANGAAAERGAEQIGNVELTTSVGVGVDQAWGRKAYYKAQARSCVRVGY